MWQAEIIDNLDFVGSEKPTHIDLEMPKILSEAMNFHLDDVLIFWKATKNILDKPDFIAFPPIYEKVLLTYQANTEKKAALFWKSDDGFFHVRDFAYTKDRRWAMNPVHMKFDSALEIVEKGHSPNLNEEVRSILEISIAEAAQKIRLFGVLFKLLTCKNIITEAIEPPCKVNKKRIRNGKIPLYRYHILKVKPFGSYYSRRFSEAIDPQSHNCLHLCRGHFKLFSEDRPLFGKYSGLFWWQPSIRGQNKNGFVDKEYRVDL